MGKGWLEDVGLYTRIGVRAVFGLCVGGDQLLGDLGWRKLEIHGP